MEKKKVIQAGIWNTKVHFLCVSLKVELSEMNRDEKAEE